jgi:hypothetical protein
MAKLQIMADAAEGISGTERVEETAPNAADTSVIAQGTVLSAMEALNPRSIVVAPAASRHTAPESDESVRHLMALEAKYYPGTGTHPNWTEYEKCRNIVIAPDKITFLKEGLSLKRTNESAPVDGKNVFDNGGHTLFTSKKAQKLFGKKMPSGDQWKDILSVIPGKSDALHRDNFLSILSIPLAGSRTSDGIFQPKGIDSYIWSSGDLDGDVIHICARSGAQEAGFSRGDPNYALSVRLFSDH